MPLNSFLDYIHTRTEYGALFPDIISILHLTIYMIAHPLMFVLLIMQTAPKAGGKEQGFRFLIYIDWERDRCRKYN